MKSLPLLVPLCLSLLGCASPALLRHAAWETVAAVHPPVPRDVASIPLLRDLALAPAARAEQIRAAGLRLAFVTYPDGGGPRLPSAAYVCFTPTHLVALLEGRQSPGYELLARPQEQEDGHIWSDDNFEIFVDPFLSRSEYFHFIVNPLGDVFDQRCQERRIPDPKAADPAAMTTTVHQDREYQSGATVPVLREGHRWVALFHLPFAGFGLTAPPLGQVWGLNFCHTNRENKELSQWRATPGRAGFHQPQAFGALRFGEAVAGLEAEVAMPVFGLGRNEIAITVRNPGAAAKLRWLVTVGGKPVKLAERTEGTVRAPCGESDHRVSFRVPLWLRGRCRVTVQLTDGERTVAYVVYNQTLGEPVSLALPLTQIYTTDTGIEGLARLGLGAGELGGDGKSVVLELTGMGRKRQARFAAPGGNLLRFQLAVEGLPPGDYALRAGYGRDNACERLLTIIPSPFPF